MDHFEPDPSAAEAVADDVEDWEPLTVEDAAAGAAEAEVEANVQEVLNAVDDLLAESEGDASVGSNDSEELSPSAVEEKADEKSNGRKKKESPLKLRRRLRAARRKLKQSSVSATRKIVTGSRETRIRDFVALPHVVRVLDKYMFTFGILFMLLTEFIVLEYPSIFRYYNVAMMLPLLMLRVVLFKRTKQQYFLLDYCYWVNSLGFLVAFCRPDWFPHIITPEFYEIMCQVFFVSSHGPLFFAMIAWNNSLVFHSIDKATSTAVHLFPALLSLCERFRSDLALNTEYLTWSHHLGYPMLFYGTWQFVYLIQTEWLHRHKLDADPELSTSLRYLSSAEKMAINKKTLKLCRSVGLMGPTETFHPPTVKVKAIFVVLQAIMTLVTFLPVRLFYHYKWVEYVVVMAILTFSVYNGARYYVQVFSRIYERRYKQEDAEEEEYVDTSAVMSAHKKRDDGDKKENGEKKDK